MTSIDRAAFGLLTNTCATTQDEGHIIVVPQTTAERTLVQALIERGTVQQIADQRQVAVVFKDDAEVPDPFASISTMMSMCMQGPQHRQLYHGLVMEEAGEMMATMVEDSTAGQLTDAELEAIALGDDADDLAHSFSAACRMVSSVIRRGGVKPGADDAAALDAALDTAWVALALALTIVGTPENLREAWARLHYSNIDGKRQPDGRVEITADGKIVKPAGWKPPVWDDLLPAVKLTPEGL